MTYLARTAHILARVDELAAISEDGAMGITRTFGTPAFVRGRDLVQGWFEQAGLATHVDAVGNLRGQLASAAPDARTLVLASHIDTVQNAGRFDGPLGVLMALDVAEHLRDMALPFHLEVVAFSDEEGVRYHTTYLGSKVLTGAFDPALLTKTDAQGTTLAAAIAALPGGNPNPAALAAAALPAAAWLGYLELHIEQGPVLWQSGQPVALVTAIAGQQRVELTWIGMAGHAGTVPMPLRQDALLAAAEFALAAEAFALRHGQGLVATVGQLRIPSSASNVIPGQVVHSLDLRGPEDGPLAAAYAALHAEAEAIAARRRVVLAWQLVQATAPATCDVGLNAALTQAIEASGHEAVRLVSGAGHDAVPVSAVAPATMLFIRCYEGISHNPLENVEAPDVAVALEVAERFVRNLAGSEMPAARAGEPHPLAPSPVERGTSF